MRPPMVLVACVLRYPGADTTPVREGSSPDARRYRDRDRCPAERLAVALPSTWNGRSRTSSGRGWSGSRGVGTGRSSRGSSLLAFLNAADRREGDAESFRKLTLRDLAAQRP